MSLGKKECMNEDRGWVLVTNDDGINAPGLSVLSSTLRDMGYRTLIVAPEHNQSAKGQSVTTDQTLEVKKYDEYSYSVSGTPVDCVRVGLQLEVFADFPLKLVVSGINNGLNGGDDFLFSGTLGAASHAARLGVPAIALSQSIGDEGTTFLVDGELTEFPIVPIFQKFAAENDITGIPSDSFLSLNVPTGATGQESVQWSQLGTRDWRTGSPAIEEYVENGFRVQPWATNPKHMDNYDFSLLESGQPTISMLRISSAGAQVVSEGFQLLNRV